VSDHHDKTAPETDERLARGRQMREQMMGPGVAPGTPATQELAPFFSRWIYESVFSDLYGRPQLDLKTRVLITMVALSVQGRMGDAWYVSASLRLGWTREEIVEAVVSWRPIRRVPAHDARRQGGLQAHSLTAAEADTTRRD
jgi:4-carboxymuconolactone decarboxylase